MISKEIEPVDFSNLAKKLQKSSNLFPTNQNALERTIIDRAYYSAFLHCREWIKKNIKNHNLQNNSKDHINVPKIIQNHNELINEVESFRIYANLRKLRKIRNHATYNLNDSPFNSHFGDTGVEDILFDSYIIFDILKK
ncbi:MAG: hypothetical protein ACRC1M_06765 [Methanobacteriaceae archaeon]